MQLRLDSADRLVELVEARRGPVPADDAARDLYALAHVPVGLARTLLAGIVESDARLSWRGNAVTVAHNARFDLAFLDREVDRLTGLRIAGPVVDTVWLARRLLAGRTSRCSLAALSHFFGTATRPCHRALPDAEATAEVLLALIGLAQERGARTVAELVDLSTPQARRVHAKRSIVHGAPQRPGVYLFRDGHGTVLYVGRARELRARLRSYFGSGRQRPSVEAALAAVAEIG